MYHLAIPLEHIMISVFNFLQEAGNFVFFPAYSCVLVENHFLYKKIYSKNINWIEICLILSASKNDVGYTFISFYCPFIAIFVTIFIQK